MDEVEGILKVPKLESQKENLLLKNQTHETGSWPLVLMVVIVQPGHQDK
jgi:hypothetical protein